MSIFVFSIKLIPLVLPNNFHLLICIFSCSFQKHFIWLKNTIFIDNIWHGKLSTIFGRFWMKGIPVSKIYFYYSKMTSEKFHDDWCKKIILNPAENNSIHKGLNILLKKWSKSIVKFFSHFSKHHKFWIFRPLLFYIRNEWFGISCYLEPSLTNWEFILKCCSEYK